MMLRYAVNHFLRDAVFSQKFNSQIHMAPLFVHDDLADIMKETPEPHHIYISTNFLRQCNADFCFLHRMGNHVLPIREPIFKSAQQCHEWCRQIIDTHGMT